MATAAESRERRKYVKQVAIEATRNALIALGMKGDKRAEKAAAAMVARAEAGKDIDAVGPPPADVDPALIEGLGTIHCTNDEIALIVGVDTSTLERNYAPLLEKARAQGKSSLKRQQFAQALKGNATMLIWLGKNYLGQTDKVAQEISGPGGGPIQTMDARLVLTAKIKDIASRRQAGLIAPPKESSEA